MPLIVLIALSSGEAVMFAFTHRIICFVSLIYFSLLLTSCSFEKSTKEVGPPKVGIIIYDSKDPFVNIVRRSIQNHFPENATSLFIDSKSDPFLQSQQVSQLVKEGIDVLVLNPVDVQMVAPFVDLAKRNSIPIIFFNREPSLNDLNIYDKSCYIGSTPLSAGMLQAEKIYELWKKHPEIAKGKGGTLRFLMLEGPPDSMTAITRTESVIKHAKELGVPLEQVQQTYFCHWERSIARVAVESAISGGIQDVDIIIANSDPMALGAMDALEEIGYNLEDSPPNKYIPIFGVDALPEALEAIRQKRIAATVKQDGEEMGRVIVKVVENALANKDFIEGTGYEWDSSKKFIHIPCTSIDNLD